MPHPIESSILRIMKPTGETVGTGFLVARNLVATCAHVVKILGAGAGDKIDVRFTGKNASTTALVLLEYWCPDDATDIAILQVDEIPAGVFPLRMGRASESRLKNDLYTFGYAIAADEQGIGGLGTFITLKQDGNFIQFRMHEANHGHSGAPIYDDQRGVVVGMIKKGHTGTGRNAETTFAIPTETIWQVCPQLKPPTPILPRRNPIVEGINLLPYDYDQRIQNFLTEYLGTDTHPVPFGGRDEAIHMLSTWLATPTPYLLLAAPAGRGKSALLVRWLDILKNRDDLALAFVPVSIRFGTNMERVFYAALAARLAFLHGDDIPASPETSTAVYRGLVADYLFKPLANGRTLLVVLDGLDEAADWQAGADFMPGELPAGVRVVVSARFLAGDADSTAWLRRLNWERNGLAAAPSLTPLDQEGVRDVLFKMGNPLEGLSHKIDVVEKLHYLSQGDPLLVGLYVDDLRKKGKGAHELEPEELERIEPGYKGYFNDYWWKIQEEAWGEDTPLMRPHIQTMLNLLSCALGPLTRTEIVSLAPQELNKYAIDNALKALRRFVIGDGVNQGYTFSHPKLGEYFWDELSQPEQQQMENRFLIWCEHTLQEFIDGKRDSRKKAEVPVYVVHNYGAHLTRAKQSIEKWLPLIHHQQWAQAWFTVEGAYGGYAQDVQRVGEQCRLLDQQAVENDGIVSYLSQQIRCALVETSLHSLAKNIPTNLIWPLVRDGIWTWPQAWSVIRQIPDSDEQEKIILEPVSKLQMMAIGKEKTRADELINLAQQLSDVITKALKATKAIRHEQSLTSLSSRLTQRLSEVVADVLKAERAIDNEKMLTSTLSPFDLRLPKERLVQMLEAVQQIGDDWSHARVLSALAKVLPEKQLIEMADVVQKVSNVGARACVLSDLAQRLPVLTVKTIEAIQEIGDEWSQARILITLAQHLPEERLELVLSATQTICDEKVRKDVLNALAQRLPEANNEVLEISRKIDKKESQAMSLSNDTQALPGLVDDVLIAARAIRNELLHAGFLSNLVKPMLDIPLSESYPYLNALLAELSQRTRADLFSGLAALMPILINIGADDTPREIYEAVRDVTAWWP